MSRLIPLQVAPWFHHRKKQFGAFFLCVGMVFVGLAIGIYLNRDLPLLSPITSSTTFEFLTGETAKEVTAPKVVYGFLPYWNITTTTLQPELTDLAYFGVTIGADGRILTQQGDDGDSGFHQLSSDELLTLMAKQQAKGGRVALVLKQFNNDDIAAFLSSSTASDRLIQSLDSILLAYPVDGINIDIEYTGENPLSLQRGFTRFLATLRQHLNEKYPNVKVSVDVYASAANNSGIWAIEDMYPYIDYVIVMAYDFHRRSSPLAGPVAPLFGGKRLWDSDITQHLQEFLLKIPREKLLLGIPFYGYEWQTTSRQAQAHTFPETGSTASFDRVQEILQQKKELKVEERWNDEALAPYLSYVKQGSIYVIYYENSRSISYKLDLVNQLHLGGIAIWALGYEGDSRELWDAIRRKM